MLSKLTPTMVESGCQHFNIVPLHLHQRQLVYVGRIAKRSLVQMERRQLITCHRCHFVVRTVVVAAYSRKSYRPAISSKSYRQANSSKSYQHNGSNAQSRERRTQNVVHGTNNHIQVAISVPIITYCSHAVWRADVPSKSRKAIVWLTRRDIHVVDAHQPRLGGRLQARPRPAPSGEERRHRTRSRLALCVVGRVFAPPPLSSVSVGESSRKISSRNVSWENLRARSRRETCPGRIFATYSSSSMSRGDIRAYSSSSMSRRRICA